MRCNTVVSLYKSVCGVKLCAIQKGFTHNTYIYLVYIYVWFIYKKEKNMKLHCITKCVFQHLSCIADMRNMALLFLCFSQLSITYTCASTYTYIYKA